MTSPLRLQEANALISVALSAGQVGGPAIAGLIVATVGAGWAVAADAATYGVSALCLWGVRLTGVSMQTSASMRRQLVDGWREFRSRTWLWAVVLDASIFLMLGYAPFLVAGAVVSKESYGGAGAWGTILAVQGAGSLAAGLLLLRLRVARPVLVATALTFLYAAPMALLAMRAPLPIVAAGALLAGFSAAAWNTLWTTAVQQQVPAEMLSRVSAYDWLGSTALFPVGFALVGPLTVAFGVTGVLWLAASVVVVTTVLTLMVPSVRNLRAPPRPNAVPAPATVAPPD